jgi:hypothetical protein
MAQYYTGYTKMKNKLHLALDMTGTPICGQGTMSNVISLFLENDDWTLEQMAIMSADLDPNLCKKCYKINLVEIGKSNA